jgi:hypothetical protein
MPESIEPTQEYFLQFMKDIGMSEKDIELNREHHGGKLFLPPATVIGVMRDGIPPGSTIDCKTGEITTTNIEVEADESFADELSMLFGDALAMPYSPENEAKMDEAFRVAKERKQSLDKQTKKPN